MSPTDNITSGVIEIVRRVMHWPDSKDIDPSIPLAQYGVESMAAITIMYEVEEAYAIVVPNEIADAVSTVNNIVEVITDLSE